MITLDKDKVEPVSSRVTGYPYIQLSDSLHYMATSGVWSTVYKELLSHIQALDCGRLVWDALYGYIK